MPLELIIGSILVLVGVFVILTRRWIAQIFHQKIDDIYGEPVADDWMGARSASMRIIVVGIFFIGFGIFTIGAGFMG